MLLSNSKSPKSETFKKFLRFILSVIKELLNQRDGDGSLHDHIPIKAFAKILFEESYYSHIALEFITMEELKVYGNENLVTFKGTTPLEKTN